MKKLILAGLIMSMAVTVQAQDGKHRNHDRMKHHGDVMQKLNLTDEQKAKLKTQHESFRKQMEEMKKNENITVKDWKSKMEGIRKEHKEKIQGILTAEQKTQLDKMKAERKERHDAMGARVKGDRMKERGEHMKERGASMKEKLGLTDEQNAKLEKSRSEMKEKMKAIRENSSLDEAAKKEKIKELMKARKENLKSILTEEQLKKMEESKRGSHDKKKTI